MRIFHPGNMGFNKSENNGSALKSHSSKATVGDDNSAYSLCDEYIISLLYGTRVYLTVLLMVVFFVAIIVAVIVGIHLCR